MDESQLVLVEVHSHIHLGVIHVNISGDAAPFETYFKDVLERWKEFGKSITALKNLPSIEFAVENARCS